MLHTMKILHTMKSLTCHFSTYWQTYMRYLIFKVFIFNLCLASLRYKSKNYTQPIKKASEGQHKKQETCQK